MSGPDSRGSEKETATGAVLGEDGGSGQAGRSGQEHAIIDELRELRTRAGSQLLRAVARARVVLSAFLPLSA